MNMEAHKERAEQLEKKKNEDQDASKSVEENGTASSESAASKAIRDSLITDDSSGSEGCAVVRVEDDVLVFSRTVNKTDSSLE
ncbi:hypothetical protein QQ045_032418 [Rhodiola kirilowii]